MCRSVADVGEAGRPWSAASRSTEHSSRSPRPPTSRQTSTVSDDEPMDYELRQLRLMAERLTQFREGAIPIARAISDLEGLLWALDGRVPQEWFDAFLEQWGELEIAYAVALDRLTPIPDATDANLGTATEEMMRLVVQRQASVA